MPAWLAVLIEALRASFWLLPSVMVCVALVAGFVFPVLDRWYFGDFDGGYASTVGLWFDGQAQGAREFLGTVAGSALTVAGVVFSITIATLSMAAGQYGPRLLRQFIADRGNQFTLGTFLATFAYCLIVLRVIPDANFGETYMPRLSVSVALALALLSIGVLIWFIHHIAESMRPAKLIADVGNELDAAFDRAHRDHVGDSIDVAGDDVFESTDADVVRSEQVGYVEAIEFAALFDRAVERDLCFRLLVRPGTYVFEGTGLVSCHPRDGIDGVDTDSLRRAVRVSPERTLAQDVEFGMDQLSEMAIRALSSGINDPRTAMTCINRLGAVLAKECGRDPIRPVRGMGGEPRLIIQVSTFDRLLRGAFDGIRHAAERSFGVQLRLIEVLTMIGRSAVRPEQREVLAEMVELVSASASSELLDADRETLRDRCAEASEAINGGRDDEASYRE